MFEIEIEFSRAYRKWLLLTVRAKWVPDNYSKPYGGIIKQNKIKWDGKNTSRMKKIVEWKGIKKKEKDINEDAM